MKNIEKMNMPVADESGEIFDLQDLYDKEGHIKTSVIKRFVKNSDSLIPEFQQEVLRQVKYCKKCGDNLKNEAEAGSQQDLLSDSE